jgi:hypothetical protein
MNKYVDQSRAHLWGVEVIVGLIGAIMSIVLHELFHIIMHWDQVPHINLLPGHDVIVEIQVRLAPGYDLEGEETVAYLITIAVILLTAAIMFRIYDAADKRTTGQILFPDDKEMQKLNPEEMLDLADRANSHRIIHASDDSKNSSQNNANKKA